MPLIAFQEVSIAFGQADLLKNTQWQIDKGQRIAVIGRNGAGKSTFLKLAAGLIQADSGIVRCEPGLKIGYLQQTLPSKETASVQQVVASGVQHLVDALAEYEQLASQVEVDFKRLEQLQNIIESHQGWDLSVRIKQILQQLSLDGEVLLSELSGGWRRRVLLAKALVQQPDVLVLDEPTNHLDIEMVKWLEEFLCAYKGAVLLISHDRSFVDQVATGLLELDRGETLSFTGSYSGFVEYKEKWLADQEKQWALFDKKLAAEEVWIRQGIKARRTRNEGRVRALKQLRNQRSERLTKQGQVNFEIQSAQRSGKVVFEAKNMSFSYAGQPIIDDFSVTVQRGDRIGFVGPNGIGKTTLIKLLLSELEPQQGAIKIGTSIEAGYFDQQRNQLDLTKTVQDVVSEGSDFIDINGRRRHIISYLEDFLFSPERCRQPVSVLSGGEANRLVLARLFSKPLNILILDEPTNDLDMETLELLESLLLQFDGTLLLVSHDRAFLDNVVTDVWAFEGEAKIRKYVGGYSDWIRQGGRWPTQPSQLTKPKSMKEEKAAESASIQAPSNKKKLSYQIQREYDQLPKKIELLESDIKGINEQTSAPGFFQEPAAKTNAVLQSLSIKQEQLDLLMERWLEIEEML